MGVTMWQTFQDTRATLVMQIVRIVSMGVTTWSTLQDIRVVMRIVRIVTVGVTMWSTLLRATLAVILLSRVSS